MKTNKKKLTNPFKSGSFSNLINQIKRKDKKKDSLSTSKSTEAIVSDTPRKQQIAVVEVTNAPTMEDNKLQIVNISPKANRANRARTSIIKALHLNSITNQLQKQRHREENKDKAKRNSSLVIPGEDKHAGISEQSVEDLLEIRNDYKESVPQATIRRKINREHEVSKRKLENVFVEEKQPIMQMKPTLIQEIKRDSKDEEDDEPHPIQQISAESARANIQPILSKLYEKKLPSEWLSKLNQPQADQAYEHILHCLLYPLLPTKHRRESLAYFYQQDFRALRKAFNISEDKQLVLFERSSMLSHYVISMLETRLSELKSNPIYQTGTFEDPNAYVAWKQEQQTNITNLLDRLQQENNFDGTLTVIVLEARDLAAKDQGSSDPYCKLHITKREKSGIIPSLLKTSIAGDKKQRKKTTVVKESLEPVWCEEFSFKLNEDFAKMELKLEMWDMDSINDHFMGEIRFPISKLADQVRRDLWIDLQRSKTSQVVSGAIHLVMHFTYRRKASEKEPPVPLPLASIAELHSYYRELIYKLIQLENPDLKEKEIQPLSEPAKYLLEEFALRYGIHSNYNNLVHLELLVEYFRYQLRRSFVEEIVQVYYNIEASKSNLVPMSIKETELYNNIIKDFEKQLVNILKRYKDVFKSMQMDGTLQLLIKIYTSIKENQGEQASNYLRNYIIAANHLFYDTFSLSQEDENNDVILEDKEKLIMTVDGCMTSIEEDVQLYEQQFPEDVEIVKLSAQTLRDRISEGVNEIIKKEEHITKTTFDVYFKINEFNEFLKEKESSVAEIPVGDLFKDIFVEWIKQTHTKLEEWSLRMLRNENWQPIDDDDEHTFIHSGSVVDIFHSISEAVKFLLTIPHHQRSNIELFIQEVIVNVVQHYIDQVQLDCISKLKSVGSSVEMDHVMEIKNKKRKSVMVKLGITKDICVRLNNIETCQTLLLDFASYLNKKLDLDEISEENSIEPLFDSCFRHVRSSLNKMIEIITEKMNSDIQEALKHVVHKDSSSSPEEGEEEQQQQRLDPLFSYLNSQLDLLSEFLYASVFQKVLKQAFVLLIKDLESIVVPFDLKDKYHRYDTVKLIEASLKEISAFFNADGEGIPSTFIDKQTSFLMRIFELFRKETSFLIQLHHQLESEYDKPAGEVEGLTSLHILSILACRKRQNREAKEFLKKRKKSLTDLKTKNHFNLEQKEEVLERFKCVGEGEIYVTLNFFCFEPSKGDERVKLAIVKMNSVTKTSMTSIQITMQDLETFKFSAIMNVSSLLEKLQERASFLKNSQLLNSLQNTEVSHVVAVQVEEHEEDKKDKKMKIEKTKKITPLPSPNARQVSVLTNEVSDAKLQKFRKKFKQSENATILAGFHCHLKYAGLPKAGKMKISEEYLCFNSLVTTKLILAFNTITDLKIDEGKIKVVVKMEDEKEKKFTFSHFDDVTAVYKFLKDMWESNLKNKL